MQRNTIMAVIIGNILEWYDFTIYGFLVPVLTSVFFPDMNKNVALLYVLGGYAVGFVMRPIGGLVLGNYGDKIGRKKIFILSIVIMTFSTFMIGIIPSYAAIGIFAPIILVFCRLGQGFSCGSEFSGSIIILFEHKSSATNNIVQTTCYAWIGSMIGTLIAAITAVIISLLNHDALYTWGWRIGFLISIIPAMIGIYFRNTIQETPVFIKINSKNDIVSWPIIDVIRKYKIELVDIIILNLQLAAFSYIAIAFMPVYLNKIVGQTYRITSIMNVLLCMVIICLIPVFAKVADRIGNQYFLKASSLCTLILIYPAYFCILTDELWFILVGVFILGVIGASIMSVIPSIIAAIIPANVRYSGLSGVYNITYCIFGGCGPLITTYFIDKSGNKMVPCYYIMIASIISVVWILSRKHSNIETSGLFLETIDDKINK